MTARACPGATELIDGARDHKERNLTQKTTDEPEVNKTSVNQAFDMSNRTVNGSKERYAVVNMQGDGNGQDTVVDVSGGFPRGASSIIQA